MNEMNSKKPASNLIWAAAFLALLAGLWLSAKVMGPKQTPLPAGLSATILPEPHPLAPFNLLDHTGKPFTNANLNGHWSFVFFGYTHCPDVCPTTLTMLNAMGRVLDEKLPGYADYQVLFISVDPERDTPEQLARFVPYFNEHFIGITGDNDAIDKLTRDLGVLYVRATERDSAGGYIVDHTASVFLLDPSGRMAALYSPPHEAGELAENYVRITDYFGARQ